LKLVLSVDALAPGLTGIGRYTWELAQGLPEHMGMRDVKFYRAGRWVNDLGKLVRAPDGCAKPAARSVLKLPRWAREWGVMRACRGNVFHGPNFFVPPCADKGVITVHDLSVFKFPETHPAERVRHFERDFSRSVAQSVHVITDSQTTRAEVMAFTGLDASRVTAVPLGVSAAYRPRLGHEITSQLHTYGLVFGAYALCVSTLEPRKKIEQLLSAWEYLPAALRSAFPLMLVGSRGWLSDALQEKIRRGAAQGWVRYLGYVPECDLPVLYAGARVFVFPSTYEGFGLPPIEAMACGVPVVVSGQSCLPEITQGAALTAEPDDIADFAAALEISLTDEAWRLHATTAGLAVAASYTWQRCIDETVKVYRRAASADSRN
jgi:glycosyltransferase involved in cell wall biosynthesis